MARPLRIELEGGMHHVVSHGNGRLWVFRNDNQRRYFLNLLGSSAFKYRVVIHTFVLMTNHVHILVKTPLPNLNQFMRKLLSDYALYYNKWYRRRGSVFKSRYGSFLIQENNYYLTVVKYICDNPVRAGIVKRSDLYRWSSLYYMLHKRLARKELSWYDAGYMLELVGGRHCLAELVGGETVELPVVYRKFVGDKEWADSIISDNYDRLSDEISLEREMKVGIIDPAAVVRVVAKAFGITVKELFGDKKLKKWCLYVLYRETPLDACRIGRIFGMNKWAVHKTVQRMEHKEKSMRDLKILRLIKRKMSNVQT